MDLSGLGLDEREAPEYAVFRLSVFRWRFAKLIDNKGEFQGVTLEIYPSPLPWLKLRFPFIGDEALSLFNVLGRVLTDETGEETTGEKAS